MSDIISNFTFDELTIGQSYSQSRTVSEEDVVLYAAVSHDTNPAHLDAEYAAGTMFKKPIAHGMFTAGLISAVIGTRFPGMGTIYLGQDLQFRRPVYIGDTLTVTLTVVSRDEAKKRVALETVVVNQNGDKILTGQANVLPSQEKISRTVIAVPAVKIV
ncbi:MaoC/PaaZ C-terminal domain-containing protein [Neisseria shayeganii]|uniref:Enoyl-CoA hydratase n=1 Tax=Neisseria shayeganii 871 TaxID=1032488 RepID=G4CL20_9NEIS|nr:MaoC/PaaZ C-terminal domain-containing protein [Neisseria shayeganii]EGY51454.1 enoyl-CoA hydratase [Neisseria shayeganii 871]